MPNPRRRSGKQGRFDGLLLTLMLSTVFSGKAHRMLEIHSRRYRAFNARVLRRKSAVGPVLAFFDVVAQLNMGRLPFESNAGTGKDFTGVVFEPGLRLSNTYSQLHKADLRDAVLTDARFRAVNLRKTIWKGSEVRKCWFAECNFQQAAFTPAGVHGTVFEDCDFQTTKISADFERCLFHDCRLDDHRLRGCSFRNTAFRDCSFRHADLTGVDLEGARFENCDLDGVNLTGATLRDTVFDRCNLHGAIWSDADIDGVAVNRSEIYGISLWGTRGEPALARELSLTKPGEPSGLEIDALHMAVFVASLMEGNGVRELVDGLSSTLVLVLGRFSPEHKPVLDAIRARLRELGYTAVIFDSSLPRRRDTSETVSVLAKLSRFVIADATDPRSVPYELRGFVTDSGTPLQVVTRGEPPFSMLEDLEKFPWVRPSREFTGASDLVEALPEMVTDLEELCERSRTKRTS